MSTATKDKTIVEAPEVRAWAIKKGLVNSYSRGRLGASVREAFNKAHRTKVYTGA